MKKGATAPVVLRETSKDGPPVAIEYYWGSDERTYRVTKGQRMDRRDAYDGPKGWRDESWLDHRTGTRFKLQGPDGKQRLAAPGASEWNGRGPTIPAARNCLECHQASEVKLAEGAAISPDMGPVESALVAKGVGLANAKAPPAATSAGRAVAVGSRSVKELPPPRRVARTAPVTRVKRFTGKTRATPDGGLEQEWVVQTAAVLEQVGDQVLLLTNYHYLTPDGSPKSSEYARTSQAGERVNIATRVVAVDPARDLALLVGQSSRRWVGARVARSDMVPGGTVATYSYPSGGPLKVYIDTLYSNGWFGRGPLEGESGGPMVDANGEIVGMVQARVVRNAPRPQYRGVYIPASEMRKFLDQASMKLAFDYPVFTAFFTTQKEDLP